MQTMEHQWYDGKSILGTVTSFIFAFIGTFSVQEWASFIAILTGVTTTIYTITKMYNESKNNKK
jgi:hypothetical protein